MSGPLRPTTAGTEAATLGPPSVVVERPVVAGATTLTVAEAGLSDADARAVHELVARIESAERSTVFRRIPALEDWMSVATSPSHFAAVAWHGPEPVAVFGLETDLTRSRTVVRALGGSRRLDDRPVFVATTVAVHPDHTPAGVLEQVTGAAAAHAQRHGARMLVGAPGPDIDAGFGELLALVLRDRLAMPVVEIDSWRVLSVDLRPTPGS